MGLSSKQVSCDGGHGWRQSLLQAQITLPKASIMKKQRTQMQHQQPLKCPRCDSLNTKFCYYNNYNKSQPRHFCKACKRHWTKGGTLRNVPVGGGRKNKRLKLGIKAASTSKSSTASSGNSNRLLLDSLMAIQWQQQHPFPPLLDCNNMLMGSSSSLLLPQTQGQEFPFSSPSSSSISPSTYNYTGEANSSRSQTWQVPSASIGMANYWNLDDIDELVSTDINNIPWVDSEIKP